MILHKTKVHTHIHLVHNKQAILEETTTLITAEIPNLQHSYRKGMAVQNQQFLASAFTSW